MSYTPKAGSEAARMVAWLRAQLRTKRPGSWSRNCTMARALKVDANTASATLKAAVDAGLVERYKNSAGQLCWRITPPVTAQPEKPLPIFCTDWPPGFKSKFLTVSVPAWDAKVPR